MFEFKKFFKTKKSFKFTATVLALFLSVFLTVSVTYAWFVISREPKVDAFQLSVLSADEALFISFDQSDEWFTPSKSNKFKASLSSEDFSDLMEYLQDTYNNGEPFMMGAVTSADGKSFTDAVKLVPANKNAASNSNGRGGYLSFNIRFRGAASGKNVNFVKGGKSQLKTPETLEKLTPIYAWENLLKTDYFFTDGVTSQADSSGSVINSETPIYTSAAYSVRYAFIDGFKQTALEIYRSKFFQYIADLSTAEINSLVANIESIHNVTIDPLIIPQRDLLANAIFEYLTARSAFETDPSQTSYSVGDYDLILNEMDLVAAKLWNPSLNAKSSLDSLVKSADLVDNRAGKFSNYYVFENKYGTNYISFAEAFCAHMLNQSPTPSNGYGETFAFKTADSDMAGDGITTLRQITGGETGWYYGSIRLNIWVEGWDANCTNLILQDKFSTNLQFSTT